MVLITRIFGAAYILTPLRIIYAVESNGVHCIPGSEATSNIRQLPCFAKGGYSPAAVQTRESALLCPRIMPSRLNLLAIPVQFERSSSCMAFSTRGGELHDAAQASALMWG